MKVFNDYDDVDDYLLEHDEDIYEYEPIDEAEEAALSLHVPYYEPDFDFC